MEQSASSGDGPTDAHSHANAARLEALSRRFKVFGEVECRGSSPLYERLSLALAEDEDMLSLAANCPEGQPVPNLLFAAVHFLLLQGAVTPLSRFYADLSDAPASPTAAYPAFRGFCLSRQEQIIDIVGTRLVQTNEVSRCSYLFPAFCLIAATARLPLALIEVGTSAGLNLLWDKYGYHYSHQGLVWTAGDTNSPVQITTGLTGSKIPPFPEAMPSVNYRVGLDLNVINLQDEENFHWLRALVWPEHSERFALLNAAAAVLKSEPPRLIPGDAAASLSEILETVPAESELVIYHTHVMNQLPPEAREEISGIITRASRKRVLYRVGNDLGGLVGKRFLLKLLTYQDGHCVERQLAYCDGHGRSFEWLA